MGHSQTIHVIGFSEEVKVDDKTFRRYECHAMNKMEMVQKKKDMAEHGTPVVGWYAQTKTGCKMIGAEFEWFQVPDNEVKHSKLIPCPICNGIGKVVKNMVVQASCMVCNGSGLTKSGHWLKWREWQLDGVKQEFAAIG